MKRYCDFNDVNEFYEFYHLNNMILEDKEEKVEEKVEENIEKTEVEEKDKKAVLKDKEVKPEYAEINSKYTNIFKNILIFTNSADPEKNKTLGNLYEAIENLKKDKCKIIPKLYVFIADEVQVDVLDNGSICIKDTNTELTLTDESNIDTLIFSRLSVQDNEECEYAVQLLQDYGFLVLNPVRSSALACNKYDTAVLLEKSDIPQPNFCLMNESILYDDDLYIKSMRTIYKDFSKDDPDKNEKLQFVVKILDGHGGTGVFLIDGKKIKAVLQTIFAISSKTQLIIQKKEEADGGDIRVHVLTLKNKQVILGAMKRVKIGGDFRSNVSLGATAEKVKLTKEQEEIALKVAKLSKMPWCAVDIMPLVKGSNKELGDNVVLEINASPGTDGISEVLEENFINILLNNLNDPTEFELNEKVSGYIESIVLYLDDDDDKGIELLAKLDTGNGAAASHFEVTELKVEGDTVKFKLLDKKYTFKKEGESNARVGNEVYTRPIITIPKVRLGNRCSVNVKIALVENRTKSTNVLINRNLISNLGYVVSPIKTHILTPEMEKVKII